MRMYNEIERPDFTPEFITELKADEVFVNVAKDVVFDTNVGQTGKLSIQGSVSTTVSGPDRR